MECSDPACRANPGWQVWDMAAHYPTCPVREGLQKRLAALQTQDPPSWAIAWGALMLGEELHPPGADGGEGDAGSACLDW